MTKQREMNRRKWLWTAVTMLYVLFIFHNSPKVTIERLFCDIAVNADLFVIITLAYDTPFSL